MAVMKTIDLFAKEKPVVQREQQRDNYSSLEYLFSKSLAEIPLDAIFAAVFTTVLKATTGLRIGWKDLTATFSLMTVAGASLGFAIGAFSPSSEAALATGIPMLVILMAVGVINPSGLSDAEPQPAIIQALQELSPIAHAVKAVCIAEYGGMEFESEQKSVLSKGRALARDLPKMGAFALVQNGEQVLNELGLSDVTYAGTMRQLAVLSAINLLVSWMGMRLQATQHKSSSTALVPL
uniref:ABC-2 type transporter transmembrane domain-containing protein n=1 Tax=Craspedostauros australis TaxID=1486917 RepID=A0A7R9ZKY9_9STRA|mmetsp:Transcript_12769/g.35264  ORF Transcript_12769/g.35264 Transcript_12769/m.35264 type:complete len:237 (+) Transcript_12769:1-711(+)